MRSEDMTYKDIVKLDSHNMEESIKSMSEFLDCLPESCQEHVTRELVKQMGIFADGHFNGATADYAISKMQPAYGTKSIREMLSEKGITRASAKESIQQAYEKARNYGLQRGFHAPRIPEDYTECDYYVALAMMMADFWYIVDQDSDICPMLAYLWMSDVDSKKTKVWDYFEKM